MNIPTIEWCKEHPQQLTPKYFNKHFPDFTAQLKIVGGFSESLWQYFYGSPEPCPICGAPTKFSCFRKGYNRYCSQKCSAKNPETNQKREQTSLERYGIKNVFSDAVKISQAKQDKYGDPHYTNREKAKRTYMEKYGVESPLQNPDIHKKTILSRKNAFLRSHDFLVEYNDDGWVCKCPHPDCDKCESKTFQTKSWIYASRASVNAEQCTVLQPINYSCITNIEQFVKDILDEHNIRYMLHNRDILDGKELDFYLPDHNIGIECNGLHWHSTSGQDPLSKSSTYHIDKYKLAQIAGIQLISLWEDQILTKPHIVKGIILSKLSMYDKRIYARKCKIHEISSSKEFEQLNHLQGPGPSAVKIALTYEDEIVAVMTFGCRKGIINRNGTGWEIIRFCTKIGVQVIGGASRLFKYFVDHYHPEQVTSYSSNDISNGSLYTTLGFSQAGSAKSYWYIDKKTHVRYHRSKFSKAKLRLLGYKQGTEYQITDNMNLWRIYDTGTTKWTIKKGS